jgi:ABC-type polysaccharide/polyol phosphate export permease
VLTCLGWLAAVAVLVPAAISSLCRRAATATTISYLVLGAMCVGTLLLWLGRGTSFGHGTVEAVLKWNPLAAALTIVEAPGFTAYHLVPDNWWWMGMLCGVCVVILFVQTWRLTRPQ